MRFHLHYIALLLAAWPLAAQHEAQIANVENLAQVMAQMKELKVPAVSVAVVENGKLAWAKAYGPINTETMFQAASISKPVAATAALHMMQYGNFTLDEDVNGKLKSWKLPGPHTVTLRQLLSHAGGLTVHGFPGYAAGEPVPTVPQVLDGEKPANTKPVRADAAPGSIWRYSGGGYTIMQLMLSDKIGWPFPQIMQRMVLGKLQMTRSTFKQPLPEDMASNAAVAHDRNGKPIVGKWHTYPEMAAAGLWTTPSDLAKWAIEIRDSYLGRSNKIIERKTAELMLTRQKENWGLGPQLAGNGPTLAFRHGGSNAGYKCAFMMVVESGQGAFVMTNGDNGGKLAAQLVDAIAKTYHWPKAE